jgi:hypothetical protein
MVRRATGCPIPSRCRSRAGTIGIGDNSKRVADEVIRSGAT